MSTYREQYRSLKRKIKFLLYENECFQEALRSTQRHLLKAKRDKSFLLDRLLRYEKIDSTLSDKDDETNSSDDEIYHADLKRKKVDFCVTNQSQLYLSTLVKCNYAYRKKKPTMKTMKTNNIKMDKKNSLHCSILSDGHMTPEEVERHLESRQNYLELLPEKAPATVPTEMFSNDASPDKLE
ncbi:uncharacterized protein LOC106641916 [Copidosoma floridanum]|uniref:uncharacterized protein LOC106641916 n=1 Tax=Copidosoma floridanum TaxID=29053 RepID=UPI0006C97C31|nr:uncharacterized protein LOC106641916 [Copidosoma floridanum]XP_014211983.1 uncharacterized protein LOC106641916 [Copidosoma floridanum]